MAIALWTWVGLFAFSALPDGSELRYSGTLAKVGTDGTESVREITLVASQLRAGELLYLIEERGGPASPWPDRVGRLDLAKSDATGIPLPHVHDGTPTVVSLRRPIFEFMSELAADKVWSQGSTRYECVKSEMVDGREHWTVDVTLDRGRRQQLIVEGGTGVVIGLDERLFLGRGEAFQLTMKLEDRLELAPTDRTEVEKTSQALLDVKEAIAKSSLGARYRLSSEQFEMAQAAIAPLRPMGASAWARFVTAVQRDLAAQSRLTDGIDALAKKHLGEVPVFPAEAQKLDGSTLALTEFSGHTTVLHFWDYDGDKLVEPYGQVGYLDFLYHRRQRLGARIVGVAVDPAFGNPMRRRTAVRRAQKLQEFMNLSFPIIMDDGTFLSRMGDPRSLGTPLPLWVVIGHDGKITHYHVGYYHLTPDEGLRELDAAVVAALKAEKAAARGKQP